ncbi:4Fe-4S binding domain-containing protein [Butyrivibrio fibrisolvens]|uniref:4Fe-4S binding domain-containing protein n=1 Tax=Butyrivibrio fibrisolvens TaxID=831 RepID=A0A1H9VAJ3_BUTFI|nr:MULTISPECIES: 4Fe-4S binding protein [Butyrivibrio]MCR4635641.1 4Fe-4S binding protein [Butyrivibrio sp.]SES18444.1 4Fe-4S binding domain-containing protein [Butyrivibrio fibrisolvens]
MKQKKKKWYDYLWIWPIIYFSLGFFNILFAWLGMIDFVVPIIIASLGGGKAFCNRYCGRGRLFATLPKLLKIKSRKVAPSWMYGKVFRYGFLIFFLTMFGNMVYQTYLVFAGSASLRTVVKLFWTFKLPWNWAYTVTGVPAWITQFSYGFYSLMLTSTLIGLIVMILYRPRTWCTFCPMGTMTQGICKLKGKN